MISFNLRTAAVCLCLLTFQPAVTLGEGTEGQWKVIADAGIEVRFRGPSEVLARQVLERAGDFLEDTSRFLGLPYHSRYTILIAESKDEFVRLQPTSRPAPEWAGALTYPGLGMVLIMTPGAMESGGSRYWSLLQHEMAHLILGDAETRHDTRLPRWFQEGIATYVSGEMNLARLLRLGWAQATGSTPDFRELEVNFPSQSTRAEAAYARSYLFIRYLSRRFGEDAVARLIDETFRRGSLTSGVVGAFNLSLGELLAGFDQYARVKATWIPVVTSTATIWGLITLLFLMTWGRKKIQGMRTLRRWDQEEEAFLAESLHREVDHEGRPDEEKRTLH